MAVKRLLDSVIFGLGATAGKRLFEEIEEKLIPPEETPEEKEKREKKERAAEKDAAKAAKAEAAARVKAKAQREAEVDRELAALKKRLGK